ncbi:MAG TPA: LysR family transcriptional regulator [Mesorhizobium sp.]
MNIRQLRTLSEFVDQGSFASTGDRVGLSPSAISIQMSRLEEDLGVALFDRGTRPPTLTAEGLAITKLAREMIELEAKIKRIARGDLVKVVTIGFVPTTLTKILPEIVGQLRDTYADLQINIKSGLSGELAAAVLRYEMDFALITAPLGDSLELSVCEIVREPLFAVGPLSLGHIETDAELITALPFIFFNKRAWLGQKIAAELQARAIFPHEGMEVDSLDTIEHLVSQGFGVSVVPQRLLASPLSERLNCVPFGSPQQARSLALIEHAKRRKTDLDDAVVSIFKSLTDFAPQNGRAS